MPTATATKKKPAASAASPLAALIALAALQPGEQFAGIVQENSTWHGVVLLPGDQADAIWKKQMAWAQSIGGDLPSQPEQSLLRATLPDEFKADWYWSNRQHASDAGSAWCQLFFNGGQYYDYVNRTLRARAVRRLPI